MCGTIEGGGQALDVSGFKAQACDAVADEIVFAAIGSRADARHTQYHRLVKRKTAQPRQYEPIGCREVRVDVVHDFSPELHIEAERTGLSLELWELRTISDQPERDVAPRG